MLTRQGWVALGVAVAAVVGGRALGTVELYVIAVALVAAVVIAIAAVRRPLPHLHVHRTLEPATITVGEPARARLTVTNRGAVRTPRLVLWEPVGDKGGAPMQLAPLGARRSCTAMYRIPTDRRGLLRTGPLRADRNDALGLASRTVVMVGSDVVTIVPQRLPLTFPTLAARGPVGELLRTKSHGVSGNEFHSQREYVPGDDLRRINWKSSARLDTLIVREAATPAIRQCTVVLDTAASEYDTASFERAVVAAASVVASADAAGVPTRLVAPEIDLRGNDIASHSLRWLATVAMSGVDVMRSLGGRPTHDGLGLVVVVTGRPTSGALGAASQITGPDDVTIGITATDAAAAPTGTRSNAPLLVDATTLASLRSDWERLVGGQTEAAR